MSEQPVAPARPSATVVLFRERDAGGEILLVQRSGRLDFHGGAWVFPGGRVDDHEELAAAGDVLAAARAAAVREVMEETGLSVASRALVTISRWTTPVQAPKRFVTWFCLAPVADDAEVRVDGREIVASRWVSPAAAIDEHRAGKLDIPPPTFVTLTGLTRARSLAEHHAGQAGREPDIFEPKIVLVDKGFFSLYAGDAGFAEGDIAAPGPRHRLYSTESGWHYERSGC
jgi:8-oxo-dGTP pyrophosphatase MutT (NUDIX family)